MGKEKTKEIEKNVRKFKKRIAKKFFVDKIVLFGSDARGKLRKDSDIDIIVVSKKYGRRDVFKI